MSDVLSHLQETGLLSEASQQAVGELALAATVADPETREALLGEINHTLNGSGFKIVDADAAVIGENRVTLEPSPFAVAGAIRRFHELPAEERRLLRVLSRREGHGGKLINAQGKPLFARAAHALKPTY